MARYPNPFAAIRSSWLLGRARQRSGNLSQTEVAEKAGIGQAALSKYESGSREPSFADLQRLIGHTDFRLEVRLRPEPRHERSIQSFQLDHPMPFAVSDLHLARRLPAQLNPPAGRLPRSEADGPRLEEALLYLYELQALAADLRRPEDRLQQTYERFHHERDRDLIHQMLSLGAGASQAARILARSIDNRTDRPTGRRSGKREQTEPRASRLTWAHIVCCLRAEEGICRERIVRLHHALDAARLQRRAQVKVDDAELLARSSSRPGALADVDQAKADLETVSRARADHSRNGGADDVGLAGERYLAAELGEFADRARALYEELAAEPAFAAWRADHAAIDPLYDAWLDGELRAASAPPRLYTDWSALAKEHNGIAEPGQRHGVPQEALDSTGTERIVADHCGQRWHITLIPVSGDTDEDPDPAAAVVAVRHAADTQAEPRPVYLLARNVNCRQAAAAITTGPASLATVTAALRST